MNIDEFAKNIRNKGSLINIDINDTQIKKYYQYMDLLLEWNKKMNLTAITEPNDIILKHFIDSITIQKYIKENSKIIDVGTGAGFPGIPLSILREDLQITLMDSLNKRINFLNEVVIDNDIKNVETIHSRAEELARNENYREQYDVAVSRAVASLNVLLEYMLPFVKVGGYCICMKGSNIEEEVLNSKKILQIMNSKIEKIETFNLPESDYGRNIIIIKKLGKTPQKYPRKAGMPAKEPII